MSRVVVAHCGECLHELAFLIEVEIRPRREHAVVVRWRGPYLTKAAFGDEVFIPHSVPERTADSPSVGSSVQNGAHDLHFAGSGIPVFAEIAVEAQRAKVRALAHPFLLQKVNGQNSGVSAVPAA